MATGVGSAGGVATGVSVGTGVAAGVWTGAAVATGVGSGVWTGLGAGVSTGFGAGVDVGAGRMPFGGAGFRRLPERRGGQLRAARVLRAFEPGGESMNLRARAKNSARWASVGLPLRKWRTITEYWRR